MAGTAHDQVNRQATDGNDEAEQESWPVQPAMRSRGGSSADCASHGQSRMIADIAVSTV